MWPDPVAFEIFGRPVYWYGILIATGVLLGIYLAMGYARRLNYDPEIILDFALLAIPFAIVGARLYYVVFQWEIYKNNPVDIFKIWQGGLAIYGAVIGGIVAALIFSRWRKVNFWDLADLASPSLILGQAIGRWGNFFNQEAYGRLVTDPAWQWFPFAVYIGSRKEWHMATFFYESMWNLLVFIFLMYYRKRRKRPGDIFLLYLLLYSCGRIVIEGLRTDSLYWGPFRVSQLLAGLLIAFSVVMLVVRRKKVEPATKGGILSDGKGLVYMGEEEKHRAEEQNEQEKAEKEDILKDAEQKGSSNSDADCQ
ncbi:phosphatidylglycerol:prolipoprotein diacylglycerol transferase [Caldicoprobacter guelmensis]|uniref:prolipoprotein diacylglyceryl transferase n=1 Tax=Caldicoprobacter guelmensis TaxID=1170224 RepID=UPI00195EE0A1|nr:phosphatidylglycerol:prolipoprotein diacylglycerol transferase [Caldicoprobacter guelmensis]